MIINKVVDLTWLQQEILDAGIPVSPIGLIEAPGGWDLHTYDGNGQVIDIPLVHQPAVQIVVDAHDPAEAPSKIEFEEDKNALDSFIAAYPQMRNQLAAIQGRLDGIETRGTQLANLSTWQGLTLAQTTARLQQVMPSLGTDMATLANDLHTICTGLDNMLQAMKVFYKQTPLPKV